jgi:hypothetical protein
MQVHQLFAFISDSISKKCIADAIDEKAHQSKQTFPEYFGTWYTNHAADAVVRKDEDGGKCAWNTCLRQGAFMQHVS